MVKKIFIFSTIFFFFSLTQVLAQTSSNATGTATTSLNPYDLSAPAGDLNTRALTSWEKAKLMWAQSVDGIKNFFSRQITAVQSEYNLEKKTLMDDINDLIQNNKIIRLIRTLFEGRKKIEGGQGG